jgi:phosphate-selective porin OprO/OprP
MNRILLAVALGLALASIARADVKFSADDGLVFRFREIDTRVHLGGRLHLDYAFFDDDATPIDDDFDVRRGRPMIEAWFGDDWKMKFEYELGVDSEGMRAAWVQWDGIENLRVRAGNQMVPFGLEEMESSNDLVFNERSIASALAPSYGTGAVVTGSGRLFERSRFTLAAGVYTQPFGDVDYDRHSSDHVSFATRGTFAPIARKRKVVHFGASVDYRSVGGDDEWSVQRSPETQLMPTLIGVTLSEVHSVTTYAFESAAMWGPVLFQAEYMRAGVDRNGGGALPDADFDGAYAQLSWVVTGERHRYSRSLASFGGVRPRSDWGAVELGVRWSMLDLTDQGVLGGEADTITAGVSWWIRENARLMFNYIRVDAKLSGSLVSDEPQVFALRFIYHL